MSNFALLVGTLCVVLSVGYVFPPAGVFLLGIIALVVSYLSSDRVEPVDPTKDAK